MTTIEKVTGLLAAILLVGAIAAIIRIVIPGLINSHTDAGLIGAGIAALFAIGLAATAILKVVELLGDHTEGHSDEEK